MNIKSSVDLASIKWVLRQLAPMLSEVQRGIVNYVEMPERAGSVEDIVAMLRKIHGIVQMLELYGAARMAEEMEAMALALRDAEPADRSLALEVWMRAALQLPDYLDRIKAGSPDLPLVLLPLLNDLRTARGATPLAEIDLFIPDLSSIADLSSVEINAIAENERSLSELVGGLRRRFMRALLDWYRDEYNVEPLGRMSRFIFEIEQVVQSQSARKTWLICRAMVDALYHKGLSPNAIIKQVLGQIERAMKDLLDWGEVAFARTKPQVLLTPLLYHIGRSIARTPLIDEVRREYRLDELLPHQDKLESARHILQGPSIELLQVTNQGVRDDITKIKDIIEIYVHAENRELSMLDPLGGLFRRVSNTLSMLGIDEAYSLLQSKQQDIRKITNHRDDPGNERLFDIATVLLKIEGMLDSHISDQVSLLGLKAPSAVPPTKGALTLKDLPEREYKALMQAVIKESLRVFARIREALIDYAAQSDSANAIKHVPGLLNEVMGVFRMLSDKHVLPILTDLSAFVQAKYIDAGVVPDAAEQEKIADTIAGIEYYLESMFENDGVHEYGTMLGMVQTSLNQLTMQGVDSRDRQSEQLVNEPSPDAEETGNLDSEEHNNTQTTDNNGVSVLRASSGTAPQQTPDAASQVTRPIIPSEALNIIGEDVDEEILEIFIAEALEEVSVINEYLPKWKADSADEESLTRIRRSFHTLKGSGRLVGAEVIGEFAWSNENLLNCVLRGDVQVSDRLFELLDESTNVLPQLIAQLRGQDSPVEIANLINNIDQLIQQSVSRQGVLPTSNATTNTVPADDVELTESAERIEVTELNEYRDPIPVNTVAGTSDSNLSQHMAGLESLPTADSTIALSTIDTALPELPLLDTDELLIDSPTGSTLPNLAEVNLNDNTSNPNVIDTGITRTATTREEQTEVTVPDDPVGHGIDPVLLGIFSKEARGHLDTLEQIFQQSCQLSGRILPNDTLIRALHTLNGSAQTTKVDQIAHLSGPLEKVAKYKLEVGQVFDIEESALLKQVTDATAATLDALLGGLKIPESVGLLARRVSDYAAEIIAGMETQVSNRGDQELRKIFIEEAEELVNASESIVARWRHCPGDYQLIDDIKRQLHTLKGGARMAGYTSMADLTHALESSVIACEDRRTTPTSRYFDLLQEAIDALAVNLEQANNNQEIQRFDWIISDLNADIGDRESSDSLEPFASIEDQPTPEVEYPGADLYKPDRITDRSQLPTRLSTEENTQRSVEKDAPQDKWSGANLPELKLQSNGGELTREPSTRSFESSANLGIEGTDQRLPEESMVPKKPAEPEPVITRQPIKETALKTTTTGEAEPQSLTEPSQADKQTVAAKAQTEPSAKVPSRQVTAALENRTNALSTVQLSQGRPGEQVRVRSELLDNLVNNAGEVSMYHARFGQQMGDMRFNLNELEQTVVRLRGQLRSMDQETEAQILYGYDAQSERSDREFDPLELDRYSRLQELSRALLESVADLENIQYTLAGLTRDAETLLLQQSRINSELQEGLMRTRMVRFDGVEARLSRVVRQTAQSLNKKVSFIIDGGENEIDRGVQERMVAPLEHVLRNAVAHGIEMPQVREAIGKPSIGKVIIRLNLDGGDILIRVVDDGSGVDLESVRRVAIEHHLISPDTSLNGQEILNLLLEPGFSTATEVTQIAGRGVGLDVVAREIAQLGGSMTLETEPGIGTLFVMRLPQTLAISQALLVTISNETYAVPINSVRGVSRISIADLEEYRANPEKNYLYANETYQLVRLAGLLNKKLAPIKLPADEQLPLLMVRSGEMRVAIQVDRLLGRREIVIKSAGQQLSTLRGIAGATLLSDGNVALVLDIGGLLQTIKGGNVTRELTDIGAATVPEAEPDTPQTVLTIMVVDDSVTIRNVTARMLERHNLNVMTAKDGVDAVSQLQERKPDLMLLDIEMPRMDGFEVAGFVRADARLQDLPIVVISSRTGEKHRQRAFNIGVNKYLGKPYRETDLLHLIGELLNIQLTD